MFIIYKVPQLPEISGNCGAIKWYTFQLKHWYTFELKFTTSRKTRIVTNFFQKYKTPETSHPDFWVIVQIDKDDLSNFYVLTHQEMAKIQMERNGITEWAYVKGMDNILLEHIISYKDKWDKIIQHLE